MKFVIYCSFVLLVLIGLPNTNCRVVRNFIHNDGNRDNLSWMNGTVWSSILKDYYNDTSIVTQRIWYRRELTSFDVTIQFSHSFDSILPTNDTPITDEQFAKFIVHVPHGRTSATQDVFLRELIFIRDDLPRMVNLPNVCHLFGLRYVHIEVSSMHLICENLANVAFVQKIERNDQLDLVHASLFAEMLGQFHGSSLILNATRYAPIVDDFERDYLHYQFLPKHNITTEMYNVTMDHLTTIRNKFLPDDYNHLVELFSIWNLDAFDFNCNRFAQFAVLTLKDLHLTEFFYRYNPFNKTQPIDVLLSTFEFVEFGVPSHDLMGLYMRLDDKKDFCIVFQLYFKNLLATGNNFAQADLMEDLLIQFQLHAVGHLYNLMYVYQLPLNVALDEIPHAFDNCLVVAFR